MSDAGRTDEPDTIDATAQSGVVEAEFTRDEWETVRSERDNDLDALQRSQAEFANYRKRVNREQAVAGERARSGLWQRMLPLIDAIDSARQHDDTVAPLWTVACDVLARDDVERIAPDPGDEFDPTTQRAVSSTGPSSTDVVVASLIRPGYRHGDHVLRAADVDVTAQTSPAEPREGADDTKG